MSEATVGHGRAVRRAHLAHRRIDTPVPLVTATSSCLTQERGGGLEGRLERNANVSLRRQQRDNPQGPHRDLLLA